MKVMSCCQILEKIELAIDTLPDNSVVRRNVIVVVFSCMKLQDRSYAPFLILIY